MNYRSHLSIFSLARQMLILFVVSIPLETIVTIPYIGSLTRLIGIGVFMTGIAAILAARRLRSFRIFHLLLILFLWWAALSYQWSFDLHSSWIRLGTIGQLLVMSILIWQLFDNNQLLQTLVFWYMAGCSLAICSIFFSYFQGNNIPGTLRYAGLGADTNDLAVVIATAVPIALFGSQRSLSLFTKALTFFYTPLAILAILLTNSRGGFLALIACLLPAIFSSKQPSVSLLAIVVLGVLIFTYFPEDQLLRIRGIPDELKHGSLTGRRDIWAEGLRSFSQYPFHGVGIGAFRSSTPLSAVSHNTFLSVAVELGLVGLLIFLSVILVTIWPTRTLPLNERSLWFGVALAWIVGASGLTWEYRKPTWLLLTFMNTWIANRANSGNSE